MRKGIVQALKFTGFLIAGIILLWLAFRNVDINKLSAGLKDADYSWLLLSLLFGFIAYVSRARRWVLLINPLGYRPTLLNSFHALMTGYLGNIALPRVGEITRCVALGKKEKIPVDQLFGTVVIERAIDLISLLIITFILFFTASDQIERFLSESIFIPLHEKLLQIFGVTWILWIIIIIIMLVSFLLVIRYKKNLGKIRFFAKIFTLARGIINGLKSVTNLERKWEFIFHTVFIWINYALMTWVIVFSLESTSHISFFESIFLLVVGGLAMSAPVQSGLGIFHYTISRGLAVIENVPIEDGLVYALLSHESQLVFIAIVGTISFFSIFRKGKALIDPLNTPDA